MILMGSGFLGEGKGSNIISLLSSIAVFVLGRSLPVFFSLFGFTMGPIQTSTAK